MYPIPNTELEGMLQHWARCEQNGYLGGTYGGRKTLSRLLTGTVSAEHALQHLRRDLPVLAQIATGIEATLQPGGDALVTVQVRESEVLSANVTAAELAEELGSAE